MWSDVVFKRCDSFVICALIFELLISVTLAEHKWPTNRRQSARNLDSTTTSTRNESDYISRRPNSYFNRLASNQPVTEPKTMKDTINQYYEKQARSQKSLDETTSRLYNSKFGGIDDRLLLNHKRRRVTCIPIRQRSNQHNGKTFFDVNLLVADVNLHGSPGGGYNTYGGYNCIPINSVGGGNPYQFINIDQGTIINRPIRPFGGGGFGGGNPGGIGGGNIGGIGGGGGGGGLFGIGQGLVGIFGHGVNYLNSYLDSVAPSNAGSIAGSIASGGGDIVAASTSDGISEGESDYDEVDEDPIRPIAEVGVDENYEPSGQGYYWRPGVGQLVGGVSTAVNGFLQNIVTPRPNPIRNINRNIDSQSVYRRFGGSIFS